LAQSADGVLWIGAQSGLYRFDGVRFEAFEPPAGQSLPSHNISALLATRDSSLWIGCGLAGVSVFRHDRLVHFSERDGLPPGAVTAFALDSAGAIWAATTTGLARFDGTRWRTLGAADGYPGGMTTDLMVDRRGTVWAAASQGVYVLPRGERRFSWWAPPLDVRSNGGGQAREAPDGSVWGASLSVGLTRLADSAGHHVGADDQPPPSPPAWALLIDRHAHAWMMLGEAVHRMKLGGASAGGSAAASPGDELTFSDLPGMSGSYAYTVLQDHEGNVWLGTEGGIDRFRATKLTPLLFPRATNGLAVTARDGGGIWAGDYYGSLLAVGPGGKIVARPEVPGPIGCAYRDMDGGLWFGGPRGIWHASGGRLGAGAPLTRLPLPREVRNGDVQALARDRDGVLWLSVRGDRMRAVFRRRADTWERFLPDPRFANRYALTIVADSTGTIWLGYAADELVRVRGDSVRLFSATDGMHVGVVDAIVPRGDHVWVGGESGVMRFDGTGFHPLAVTTGGLRGVTGIVETDDGDLWLNGLGGVTHVRAADLRRAMRGRGHLARAERFDYHDGLVGVPDQVRPLPSAIEGIDGRLWFLTVSSVAWLDPAHIHRNRIPPPVEIRTVTAGNRTYTSARRVELPARTTGLRITYTALSLSVPDRVRFRYRLVGGDTGWMDAGMRREAFLTELGPGSYRFQVAAANEDGVWNEAGAAFDFTIPPAFTQTPWFVALWVAALGGLIWALYLLRTRQLAAGMRARYQAALDERTRIAQELHDTLLQGFTGITFKLRAIQRRLMERPAESASALDDVLGVAEATLRDARHMIWDMRAAEVDGQDLADALERAARQALAGSSVELAFSVSGDRRRLPLDVETAAMRIGRESVLNALKHAAARSLQVRLDYGPRRLLLEVVDDGKGFAPGTPEAAAAGGHWGIAGMKSRAERARGTLGITSVPGRGTTVSVSLPAGDGTGGSLTHSQ
jgi:signal transduction histidine kinase/ligand-binding sensor domain-containing protein